MAFCQKGDSEHNMTPQLSLYGYQETIVAKMVTTMLDHNILLHPYAPLGTPPYDETKPYDFAKLLLTAPTGAGKTPIIAELISRLDDAVKAKIERYGENDGERPYQGVVYVFIAPNTLHLQAADSFGRFGLGAGRRLIQGKEILEYRDGLENGDVLFLNWPSINKDSNELTADNEFQNSIQAILRKTRDSGFRIAAIVDEAHNHLDGPKNAEALKEFITPDIRIAVTATPGTKKDILCPEPKFFFEVSRDAVRAEHIIVDTTYINLEMEECAAEFADKASALPAESRELLKEANELNNAVYVYAAIRWLNRLQETLDREIPGNTVNLAAGIQLPDAKKAIDKEGYVAENAVELEKKAEEAFAKAGKMEPALARVLNVLELLFDWTVDNGKVAIWTATRKNNFLDAEGREAFSSNTHPAKVLIFKQAVAVGYDAPRLSTLALLRNTQSRSFALQVVGRASRMPERVHYNDASLNAAYVFTLSELVADAIKNSQGGIQEAETVPVSALATRSGLHERIAGLSFKSFQHKRQGQNDIGDRTRAMRVFREGLRQVGVTDLSANRPIADILREVGFDIDFKNSSRVLSGELVDGADSTNDSLAGMARVIVEGLTPNYKAEMLDVLHGVFLASRLNASRSAPPAVLALADFAAKHGWSADHLYSCLLSTSKNATILNNIWSKGIDSPVGRKAIPDEWHLPEETVERWHAPDSQRIPAGGVLDQFYYYARRPASFDSGKENHIPSVALRTVTDLGLNLRAYFKAEGLGLESLAIPYTLGVRQHLFFPDWFFFFEVGEQLHMVILETKSYNWRKATPEEITAKTIGLEDFVLQQTGREDVIVHGGVVNMYHMKDGATDALGFIKVVDSAGIETDFDVWLTAAIK